MSEKSGLDTSAAAQEWADAVGAVLPDTYESGCVLSDLCTKAYGYFLEEKKSEDGWPATPLARGILGMQRSGMVAARTQGGTLVLRAVTDQNPLQDGESTGAGLGLPREQADLPGAAKEWAHVLGTALPDTYAVDVTLRVIAEKAYGLLIDEKVPEKNWPTAPLVYGIEGLLQSGAIACKERSFRRIFRRVTEESPRQDGEQSTLGFPLV